MNLSEWKKNFLEVNSRTELTGSPIYAYKVTSDEFADLRACLIHNVSIYTTHYEVNEIFKRSSDFPQLFVLYAAIWWQREYDGTGMAWEPIFDSININVSDLNSNIRSEAIEKGFQLWRLKLNNDIGNLKFIGNIASQGGLPLKLIASDKSGGLNRLLKRVLKDVVNLAFPDQNSVLDIIESHQSELQRSYRQKEIFGLLAEIIITFVYLKAEAKLEGESNPLEKLTQYNANWRDSFPLPMDDGNARGVLERFIQEGIKVKAERPAFTLSLNRYLQFYESQFKVISRLDLPKQNIDEDSVIKSFGLGDEFMTRMMRLNVSNNQETYEVLIKRLAGQSNYRFEVEKTLIFKKSEHEHFATLKNAENVLQHVDLINGYELDDEIPWIFEASDDADDGKFIKVGAGRFKSAQLYVVVPLDFNVSTDAEPIGSMQGDCKKKCYLVNKALIFSNNEGDSYVITPGSSDANDEIFALSGNRFWHVFQKPAVAFSGVPQVNKLTSITLSHKKASQINALCKNLEHTTLNQNLSIYGPLDLVVKEQGSNVWASKVAVLPDGASYTLCPGDNANHGVVKLSKWQINNIKCLDEDVALTVKREDDIATVSCKYIGAETPNELISFELFWSGNPKTAIVRLPFPSAGVIAFDANGKRLNRNKPLSLLQIYGVRIVTLLSQGNFVEIELSLKETGEIRVEPISLKLKRDRNNTRLEIRLVEYKEKIADLLYAVDHLDSKVEFRVRVAGAKDFILFVTKYDIEFEHRPSSPVFMIKQTHLASFDNTVIEKCQVKATRIDGVDDVISLTQSISEGVCKGIWEFPVNKYSVGDWMVYPSPSSSIQFRPMILTLGEEQAAYDEQQVTRDIRLKDALGAANYQERQEFINAVLEELVEDFNHISWTHVEYLAEYLGHLNLTSLDIWRYFAKNKRAMATLALRDGKLSENFIHRFATELPFIWEFVSLDAWLDAAFYLKKQLYQIHDDEIFAQQYFEFLLGNKLNAILANQPSLNMIFEIIKYKNGLKVNQEMQGTIGFPQDFEGVLEKQLFNGADSELQKLLRHDGESWPNQFINEVGEFRRTEHRALLCNHEYGYKEAVINLPIILAITSLTGVMPLWLDNESQFLEIKKIKNFDQDWFASAFDKTIARAITKGYIQL